jgi:hypothetical protein
MSEVIFLRSESDLESGVSKFPDLKSRLEQQLNLVKEFTDLEHLIQMVNDLGKESRFSTEEKNDLKRIRQRAYDRKRNYKPLQEKTSLPVHEISITPVHTVVNESIQNLTTQQEEKPMPAQPIELTSVQKEVTPLPIKKDFWTGVESAFEKIDGERFVQALPGVLALLLPTILVVGFLWFQSMDLYKSSGFSNPEYAAAGGLLMVIGFATFYSIRKSKLALLLCLYAGTYEIYFMASGTVQDEKVVASSKILETPEMVLLKEKADKAQEGYQVLKTRYDDPTSNVHNNSWFKTKQLEPAWDKNEQAQKEFITKRNDLAGKDNSAHVTWLKIFYRLGLVFLCMVLVHGLVRRFKSS